MKQKKLEPMIDYKYPIIASGATPIGSAGRAPNEELLWEERWRITSRRSSMKSDEEKFESIIGGKHQKMKSTFTPIGRADSRTRRFWALYLKSKIYKVGDWRNRRFQEVEDIWSRRLKKSNDWRNRSLKKSKIEEVRELKKSKIWSLETQPESATQVESQGLLTWVCPSGTHGLVYWVRSIMKVDKYKDSKIDLETKKEGSNPYSTGTLVKP
jgi:hypothetical protein